LYDQFKAILMKIIRIEIYKSPIKLKKPFVISLGAFDYAENIVVVIRTNDGLAGFGECSPFMLINGESMETCYVVADYLAKAFFGKNPLDIEGCSGEMDRVIFGNSSIKSALDIAFYDIASQHAGLPLYVFLGGKNDKPLVTDYAVSLGLPEQMAADAKEIKERGFRIIKVKLGENPETDIFRIKAIHKRIGAEIALRLDANQGWNTQSAIRVLNELASENIPEDPVLGGIRYDGNGLVTLPETTGLGASINPEYLRCLTSFSVC